MNALLQRYVTSSVGLLERGHWQEGLLLAERGLSEPPLEIRSLLEFVERAVVIAGRDEESHAECLARLEGLVRRVLFAELDDIDAIIACAESLSSRRAELLRTPESEEPPTHSGAELAELLAAARGGTLAEVVAANDDVSYLRQALEAARELAEGEPAAQEALTGAAEDAELAASFDEAAKESWALLARVETWISTRSGVARAGIALQHVEGTLRPFGAFSHRLDPRRVAVTDTLLDQLRQAATRVAKQAQETDAAERWGAFEREYERTVCAALESTAPSADIPDGHCQGLLDRIRLVQERLLPLLPALQDTEAWTRAREYAEALGRRGNELAQQQQRRYELWALAQVRRGFVDASEHIGTVMDDKEKIARVMINAFGVVDVRLLGYEVQRSFNEVFELLYQHLDRPKKEADLDAEGGKLHVLAQMVRAPKRALTEF